ncbi:STN domain-containing protein [Sphingomonas sp. H39-1-10]|uniref:STN domain-containing protein n=1 Tax=Sphingomonas pollutisoli TaxID=3030829 RepID=UPI0023B9835B|nr:STN domain-containing protein [Sphingomonas pollutisoli]MDF0487715.1 STN domain-containing protein [Sphingomonas pollutisoli]
MRVSSLAAIVGPMISIAIIVPGAAAHEQHRRHYDLPAQELRFATRAVARRVGYQLVADADAIRGKLSKPLKGDFTVQEAIAALLEGQGLSFEIKNRTIFIRAAIGTRSLATL